VNEFKTYSPARAGLFYDCTDPEKMKVLYIAPLVCFAAFVLLLGSCTGDNHSDGDADTLPVSIDTVAVADTIQQSIEPKKPQDVWKYDDDNCIAVRISDVRIDTLTPVQLVEFFNATYTDSMQLEYERIHGDTIFVRVLNEDCLTQRSGTTGAEAYLMVGTFTLTESPRINYVYFDFEEGDHAVPGTYSRKMWYEKSERYKELNRKK
jgi:hypothetical protein